MQNIVSEELKHIAAVTSQDKDFRAAYQRERLRTLFKTPDEPVAKTLLRVMDATKTFTKVSPRIFVPDMLKIIEPQLPISHVAETSENDIQKWHNLPCGQTILIFRPVNYPIDEGSGTKDFMGVFSPTHAYALTAWLAGGTFDFTLTTSYCPRQGGLCNHEKVSNNRRYVSIPWKLDEEGARYDKFVAELGEFMTKGKF